jgi:hypothetical protein
MTAGIAGTTSATFERFRQRLQSQWFINGILPTALGIVLVARIWTLANGLEQVPRFIDEESNIYSAYYYKLLFVDHDISNEDWQNPVAYDYPPVRKYIYGLALQLVDGKTIDSCAGYKAWHLRIVRDWFRPPLVERAPFLSAQQAEQNSKLIEFCDTFQAQLVAPPAAPLTAEDYKTCRWTGFLIALAAAGLLSATTYFLCRNVSASILTAIVFLTNGVTIPGFQQALNDSIWCFFAMVCLVLLFVLAKSLNAGCSLRKSVLFAILLGGSLALALQTKLIAAYMVVVIALVALASIILASWCRPDETTTGRTRSIVRLLTAYFVTFASAGAIFVLLNPYLYHDTLARVGILARHRTAIMQMQSAVQEPAITSTSELLEAIYRHGILLNFEFRGAPALLLLYAYMLIVGIALIQKNSFNEIRRGAIGPHAIAVAWILSAYAVVGPRIHMDWERYFLPFAMCTAVALSVGAAAHFDAIQRQLTSFSRRVGNEHS